MENPGTFESAEKALRFLGETDKKHGMLKARHQALDKARKAIRYQCFLSAEGKSIPERNAKAENDSRYRDAVEDWENAMADFYTLDAQRSTAQLLIETWRSVNSNQRKGNI